MTPKKIFALFSFLSLAGTGVFITFSNFDAVKEYASLSYNHTEVEQEEQKIIKPGTTERLIFHNVNNQVFLLESFQNVQSKDLYILTEAKKLNSSEVSHINCVICKDKYSFYDDLNECVALKVESTHRTKPQFPFATTFFRCKIPSHIDPKNYPLSTLKIADEYGHLLQTNNIDKNETKKDDLFITMCAGPQFGKHKKAINLAEWIEFHRLMGVSKFQIYVTDKNGVSKEYHSMLKRYVEEGIVDLIYWESLKKSHYYSQNSLLNHCVWRNKINSDLVVFNDIDEFFVPANNSYDNWNEAFQPYLENANNSEIRFRNWFYDATCPDKKEKSELMFSSVFIRAKKPFPPTARTKCILRPERILLAGVHHTIEFMPEHKKNNYTAVIIPPKVGYMAHFTTEKLKTPKCDLKKGKDVEINKDLEKYGKMIEGKVKKDLGDDEKLSQKELNGSSYNEIQTIN